MHRPSATGDPFAQLDISSFPIGPMSLQLLSAKISSSTRLLLKFQLLVEWSLHPIE